MEIDELKRKWDYLGASDPLWAIMTDDSKKGNQWDQEEFFATGRGDAARFIALARHLMPGLEIGYALDFGCGVGRLTQGHADYAEKIVGVDISGPMIAQARAINPLPGKVEFLENDRSDLSMFADGVFAYIICHIVLQHVPAEIHLRYVREFVRVLRRAGVCIFQLPETFTDDWGSATFTEENKDKIDMYGSAQSDVLAAIQDAGGRVLEVKEDGSCGPQHVSYRYVFTKV